MAGATKLRLQLLEQMRLPHDDAEADADADAGAGADGGDHEGGGGGAGEGVGRMMAVGEDGLASLALQEAVSGDEPRNEMKLLCMLRIRRMPDANLLPCAQHGSVRFDSSATFPPSFRRVFAILCVVSSSLCSSRAHLRPDLSGARVLYRIPSRRQGSCRGDCLVRLRRAGTGRAGCVARSESDWSGE